MVEISTSLLSVNSQESLQTFYNLEVAHTDYFHIDVMDGIFVENDTTSIMEKYSEYLSHISLIPQDIHLMVKDVKKYIDKFLVFKPNTITFQIEAIQNKSDIIKLIKYIQENGCKTGIAISPKTEISSVYEFLPYLHQVTIMTVEPGKGGQKLINSTIEKVKQLKNYIEENNFDLDIEVDGGINTENVNMLKQAGANIIVAGTAIINSDNFEKTIKELKQ